MERRHECSGRLPEEGYGEAVNGCGEREDGTLWVGNGEYGSQVVFCPYCGYRAKEAPTIIKELS